MPEFAHSVMGARIPGDALAWDAVSFGHWQSCREQNDDTQNGERSKTGIHTISFMADSASATSVGARKS